MSDNRPVCIIIYKTYIYIFILFTSITYHISHFCYLNISHFFTSISIIYICNPPHNYTIDAIITSLWIYSFPHLPYSIFTMHQMRLMVSHHIIYVYSHTLQLYCHPLLSYIYIIHHIITPLMQSSLYYEFVHFYMYHTQFPPYIIWD